MGIETALIIASVGSAVVSAAGQIKQGQDTATANRYQGEELTQQAAEEKQAASAKIISNDYESIQTLGRINANAGAAGVTTGGSVSDVATASAEEAKINDMYTKYSGNLAALKDVYAAKQLNYEGDQAKLAGFVGAGQTLTSALTNAYGQYKYGIGTKGTTPGQSPFNTY